MSAYQMTRAQFLQALERPMLTGADLVMPWKLLSREDQRSCFHIALGQSIKGMSAHLFLAVWEQRSQLSLSVPKQLLAIYLQAVEHRRLTQDAQERADTAAIVLEVGMAQHLAGALSTHPQTFSPASAVLMVRMGIPYLFDTQLHKEAFQAAWSMAPQEERLSALEEAVHGLLPSLARFGPATTVGLPSLNRFLHQAWLEMELPHAARVEFIERFLPVTTIQSTDLAVEEMKAVTEVIKVNCLGVTIKEWTPRQNWLEALGQLAHPPTGALRDIHAPANAQHLGALSRLLGYDGMLSVPVDDFRPLLRGFFQAPGWERRFGETMALQAEAAEFALQENVLVESVFIMDGLRRMEVVTVDQYAAWVETFVSGLTRPLEEVIGGFDEGPQPFLTTFRMACQQAAMEKALPASEHKAPRTRF